MVGVNIAMYTAR